MDEVYLFYNVFSWWIVFWVFSYIIKLCPIEPFIAVLLTIAWDIYVLVFHNDKPIPIETSEQKWVQQFRILLLVTAHWVPFFTLPVIISKESVMLLISLAILYMTSLYLQKLTIFNIYDYKYISGVEIKTFKDLFILRFNNYFMTLFCLSIIFYSGYTLLKKPYKNSLVYKYQNR